jgi:hypothetical protein
MVALGVALSTAAATQGLTQSAAYQAAEQDLMAFSFLGKIFRLAENSLQNETDTNSTAKTFWEKKGREHHEGFGDDSDYAELKSQIAFNLRAKFEGDELEAMKTKIAMNLREKFRERDEDEDDEKEGHDNKKEQDHEKKVGEHDGDRRLVKKNASHGQNETRKNETHNGKHNETRRNETHSKRNETKKHGGDNNFGENNETHPEGPIIGENEDEHYFNEHKNKTNQTDKYRTVFLQAVPEPATPAVEQDTGLPWYYTVGLAVAGLAIIGFVGFFIKKTCFKQEKADENFHKDKTPTSLV